MKKKFKVIKKSICQKENIVPEETNEEVARAVEFEFEIDKPNTPVSKTIEVEVDVAEPEIIVEQN